MDLAKFEEVFPKLLEQYRVVRRRDYYREPPRNTQAQNSKQGAVDVTKEVAASDSFWPALEKMLGKDLNEAEAVRVRRAFTKIYQGHIEDLNLEDIEEVAREVMESQQATLP